MKKILWIFSSALLLSLAIFSTGCGTDPVDELAPVVTISTEPSSTSYLVGDVISFTVSANKGTQDLAAITVLKDGSPIDVADLTINGTPAASATVAILTPADNMTFDIDIVASEAGTFVYTVKVTDKGNLSDEIETDEITVGTAVETIEGVDINLWNQGGPVGKGGIDLDNGNSTGSFFHVPSGDDSYLQAELRDLGLDSLAGVGNGDNWRRRIGGINGTEVRYVGNTNSSAEFANVASKEAIIAAFDGADDLTPASQLSANAGHFEKWGDFKVSDEVAEGDVFAIYKSSTNTYYLVVVNEVVETTTFTDNTDHYNVSIKY